MGHGAAINSSLQKEFQVLRNIAESVAPYSDENKAIHILVKL